MPVRCEAQEPYSSRLGYSYPYEFCSYDPCLFKYIGADPATVEWAWESVLPEGSDNKYELCIMKEMIPGLELAETFGIGVAIMQEWDPVDVLPNTAVTDDNANGAVPMLEVYTNY